VSMEFQAKIFIKINLNSTLILRESGVSGNSKAYHNLIRIVTRFLLQPLPGVDKGGDAGRQLLKHGGRFAQN
jgi:hypothetical protein